MYYSQRTRDIEDAIDSRTGDSALRWPTLFKDLNLARQRALMIVKETLQSRAHLFIASSAALKLVAQIITLFFAICKVSTIEKTNISQSSQHWGSDSFVRKYLMIAFNEHSITRLSVAHADVLFGVAAIAQTHFISLVLPFIMWFLGAYRMSIGLRGITALQNQWAGRVLLTSNDEVDFLRNHEVSNHRSENGGEWEVLAPSKIHGITLDHVTAVGSGRVRLRVINVCVIHCAVTILCILRRMSPYTYQRES